MKSNRKPTDCGSVLKRAHVLFYGGFVTMAACWGILAAEKDLPGYLFFLICMLWVVGIAVVFAGLHYAKVHLRCPKCGQSLMLGGKLPRQLPHYCPNCGERL